MLETFVVVGATLVLMLLCGVLILPSSDGPVRQSMDPFPTGEAATESER